MERQYLVFESVREEGCNRVCQDVYPTSTSIFIQPQAVVINRPSSLRHSVNVKQDIVFVLRTMITACKVSVSVFVYLLIDRHNSHILTAHCLHQVSYMKVVPGEEQLS